MVICGTEEGAADAYILEHARSSDLVITRDIPLAAELVRAGIAVLNDRGTEFGEDNIRQRLSERNFMAEMRERGIQTPVDSAFGKREVKSFANAFDRTLIRLMNLSDSGG
jgi:uncharacterized protein YaiI (UPF0178 family)